MFKKLENSSNFFLDKILAELNAFIIITNCGIWWKMGYRGFMDVFESGGSRIRFKQFRFSGNV